MDLKARRSSKDGREWVGAASLAPRGPVAQPVRQIAIFDQTQGTADDDLADFFGLPGQFDAVQCQGSIHRAEGRALVAVIDAKAAARSKPEQSKLCSCLQNLTSFIKHSPFWSHSK
jgi:hypothetical protein